MTDTTGWITAAAVVASGTFILKTFISVWVGLEKRIHLCSALNSYVADAYYRNKKSLENFSLENIKAAIDSSDGYTPYIPFDPRGGFSIQDVRQEYGFLDSDAMDAIVTYLNAESYIQSMCEELKSEYIRSFPQERKHGFMDEYESALNEAVSTAKIASEKISAIAARGKMEHIKNALT